MAVLIFLSFLDRRWCFNACCQLLRTKCLSLDIVLYNCDHILIMPTSVCCSASIYVHAVQSNVWQTWKQKAHSDSRLQTAMLLAVFSSAFVRGFSLVVIHQIWVSSCWVTPRAERMMGCGPSHLKARRLWASLIEFGSHRNTMALLISRSHFSMFSCETVLRRQEMNAGGQLILTHRLIHKQKYPQPADSFITPSGAIYPP